MGKQSEYPHHTEYIRRIVLPWERILNDFNHQGRSDSYICRLLGVPLSTYQRWKSDTEPKYSYGISILTLHVRICGKELTAQRLSEMK